MADAVGRFVAQVTAIMAREHVAAAVHPLVPPGELRARAVAALDRLRDWLTRVEFAELMQRLLRDRERRLLECYARAHTTAWSALSAEQQEEVWATSFAGLFYTHDPDFPDRVRPEEKADATP